MAVDIQKLSIDCVRVCDGKTDKNRYVVYHPKENVYFINSVLSKLQYDNLEFRIDEGEMERGNEFALKIYSPMEILTGYAQDGHANLFSQDRYLKPGGDFLPTLHISMTNIFKDNMFDDEKAPACVPRSYLVMDSSIWNTLIMIDDDIKNFTKSFYLAIEKIYNNYKRGLYRLSVSHEYANLNARMTEHSYLSGSHGSGVSPFVFHSEQYIAKDFSEGTRLNNERGIKGYKWRFLLVDDKSVDKMDGIFGDSPVADRRDGLYWNCKMAILKDVIEEHLGIIGQVAYRPAIRNEEAIHKRERDLPQSSPTTNTVILIEYAESLEDAKRAMMRGKYDIVLLDYLLDKSYGVQNYGYDLLNDIWKDKKHGCGKYKKNKGPLERFYFMFISAYTTAVHERLLEQGLNRSEPGLWYIGDGACPTNTPCLFMYQLLQLMRYRIEELSKETEGGSMSIIDLLELIYVNPNETGTLDTRENAYNHFNHLLFMREKYRKLESDLDKSDEKELKELDDEMDKIRVMLNMKSSWLVYSAFNVVHFFSGSFFEHLQHLVYLTAYGTIRQWQEMWEEYVFVYKKLCEYDDIVKEKDDNGIENKRGTKISNAIRTYIINLKKNSNG